MRELDLDLGLLGMSSGTVSFERWRSARQGNTCSSAGWVGSFGV